MATQVCPECNNALPADIGVHATSPVAGAVQCPHCGCTVMLEKPAAEPTGTGTEEAGESSGGAFDRARQSLAELNPDLAEDAPATEEEGLEAARAKMWEAASKAGAVPGTGVQEEETARIADHLVFPGTGIDDLQKEGESLDETLEKLGANEADRAREGSLEQAARLGRESDES